MSIIVRAAESVHWYRKDGTPQYTVIGKDGKERASTLRDARKMDLVPSVTTILKTIYKPALEVWKQEQLLLAALTLPKQPNETEKSFIARVMYDSKETGRLAADRGTEIHESIEKYYREEPVEHIKICEGFDLQVVETFGNVDLIPEESFGGGFGGKVDLHDRMFEGTGLVLDIKTKEFGPDDEVPNYEDNLMQLAAYRVGLCLPNARCANVFVSRNHPGLVKVNEWSQEDLERGWEMFSHLLKFWRLKNKF